MAGSWSHMTLPDGRLRNNETFTGMLDNLGDAYEAAEECYGMVWWLAAQLARLHQPITGPAQASRDQVLELISEAAGHYRAGLDMGGVEPY